MNTKGAGLGEAGPPNSNSEQKNKRRTNRNTHKAWNTHTAMNSSSSLVSGLGSAVGSMWRSHGVLRESDSDPDPDSSPEAPQHFRKVRSASSLRMSLRKRLPLRTVHRDPNIPDVPEQQQHSGPETLQVEKKPSTVCQIKRTAKNSIGSVYQKLQRSLEPREECLVQTPGRICEGEENAQITTHTPKRTAPAPKRTPRSGGRRHLQAVKTRGGRRQLVRAAALKSPFSSPNTTQRSRQFDQDLDSVATGLRKLKRLSQAFNDVIGREERAQAMEHYRSVVVQSSGSVSSCSQSSDLGRWNRASIQLQSRRIRQRVCSWSDSALSSIRKNDT